MFLFFVFFFGTFHLLSVCTDAALVA
jgi:hypothetical protein